MRTSIIFPPASRWGIFLISFCVLFITASLGYGIVNSLSISSSAKVLSGSAIQGILAFILPTWITFRLTSQSPAKEIGLNRAPSAKNIIGVILFYALTIPAMNQIIYYNANMTLPDTWHELEELLRSWEEAGASATQQLLSNTSLAGLISNILIIGVLTGFAEEMFFRGGIQRLLILSHCKPQIAVWVAAIIFSTVHFQFFGFVPRVLLGAMFGYIYLWTGNIWYSALMHALNNSIVVVTTWLTARGIISTDFETFCVQESGFPWIACLSILATAVFLFYFRRRIFLSHVER